VDGVSEPRSGVPRAHEGFSLAELLIVIGIIGLLIAILLPVIHKVRRKAVVLACPIVYHSLQDNALHVTDTHGGHDLAVTPTFGQFDQRRPGHPMWSPSGQKIGFELSNWTAGPGIQPQYMCVLDPMSGAIKQHKQISPNPRNYFKGWVDDDHFVEGASNSLYVRDADTGQICQTIALTDDSISEGPFHIIPPSLPGRWVSNSGGAVRLVRSDFTYGRTVWGPPPGNPMRPYGGDFPVEVDVMGEWVAWNAYVGGRVVTGIKGTSEPPWTTPATIAVDVPGKFTLWTDDGNMLLTNLAEMTIVDRSGAIIRSFATPYGIDEGAASMRRYWHR
jgi:prepilin-type N-terminal cleavage/methylation domain-containing protein